VDAKLNSMAKTWLVCMHKNSMWNQ
jgi:hypothetical protein